MLQLLLQLAQSACPSPLPLQLQEALAAAGGIDAVKGRPGTAGAGGGSELQEQLTRHLTFQCDQLQAELSRTHVHYTTLLDRLAGPSWQQNAEALDRAGGGGSTMSIHRPLTTSTSTLLGVSAPGGPGDGVSTSGVRFTGIAATGSRSSSPTHGTLGATSRPGSALGGRTVRSGSPGATSSATLGRGGSPDAHTNLLMNQIESLRRALTAAEEREALLESEALALQVSEGGGVLGVCGVCGCVEYWWWY